MKSETYEIGGRKLKVDRNVVMKQIYEILGKAKLGEINPRKAYEEINEHLSSNKKNLTLSELFSRFGLLEAISSELDIVSERYVLEHGISGRLTT